jgi:hypothetical protein
MRYFYKQKDSDFYNPHILDNPLILVLVSLVALIFSSIAVVKGYRSTLIVEILIVSVITFLIVTTYQCYQAKKYLKTFRHLISYLVNYGIVEALNTSMLNSKSSASMTNKKYRVLPKIWLWYDSDVSGYIIRVEKLAGTYKSDLDHLAELISSSMGDHYEVTSKAVSRDGSWFNFVVSQVQQNLRFVPKSINDLVQKPYCVKLMNNLTINFASLPHLSIFGKTSSGKSTVLWAIVLQTIGNSQLYFIDFKNEFSVLSSFYPSSRFATDTDQIIQMLQKLVSIMTERKKFVQREAKKRGVIGLTGYDLHLTPIFLVVDEFASVLSAFDNTTEGRKQKKLCESLMLQILMQSRAYSIYVLYSSQSPSTEVLSQQMRSQFGTYILLGSANSDVQRMAFGQVAYEGNLEKFSGYYLQNTADMTTPQLFEVPNIFENNLNTVDTFKQMYLYNRKEKKNV